MPFDSDEGFRIIDRVVSAIGLLRIRSVYDDLELLVVRLKMDARVTAEYNVIKRVRIVSVIGAPEVVISVLVSGCYIVWSLLVAAANNPIHAALVNAAVTYADLHVHTVFGGDVDVKK